MTTHKWALLAAVLVSTGIGLSGCGVGQSATPATSSSAAAAKTPKDYVAGLADRSLTTNDVTAIDVAGLPSHVPATSGVSFTSESGLKLSLLQFDTQAQANQAKAYYVSQGEQTYTDRQLLLVGDRGLAKGWFEKYRSGIFKQ